MRRRIERAVFRRGMRGPSEAAFADLTEEGEVCRLRRGARRWPTPKTREVRYRRGGPGSRCRM